MKLSVTVITYNQENFIEKTLDSILSRKCSKCYHYTLKEKCSKCSEETISAHPAKFSPDDKYMRYRLAERYS